MVEALGLAVADRPVGEERRIAAAACVKQRPPAPDVQKRLLLAGKAGVGQVLGGGAAANGGCRIGQAQPFAQLLIGGAYPVGDRSEEHTSELQSLMRISYAVFCLKKKNKRLARHQPTTTEKRITTTK